MTAHDEARRAGHGTSRVEAEAAPVVDLADIVIHRLFGVGLVIQSAASLQDDGAAGDPVLSAARSRLQHAVEELDLLIRDVRLLAFGAATGDGAPGVSARNDGSMSCAEARQVASHHVERAASLLAEHQPPPEYGAGWWAVETAQRHLHGAVIALGDSSLRSTG